MSTLKSLATEWKSDYLRDYGFDQGDDWLETRDVKYWVLDSQTINEHAAEFVEYFPKRIRDDLAQALEHTRLPLLLVEATDPGWLNPVALYRENLEIAVYSEVGGTLWMIYSILMLPFRPEENGLDILLDHGKITYRSLIEYA